MKKLLVLLLLIAFVSPLFAFDFFATLDDEEEGQVITETVKPKELTSLFVEGFGTYYPLDEDEPSAWNSLGVLKTGTNRTEVDFFQSDSHSLPSALWRSVSSARQTQNGNIHYPWERARLSTPRGSSTPRIYPWHSDNPEAMKKSNS